MIIVLKLLIIVTFDEQITYSDISEFNYQFFI